MKQDTQVRLDRYLGLLNEIKGKVGDEVFAMRILSEIAKDQRMDQIREEKTIKAEPVTTRQLQFMRNLGIEAPPGCSKTEASRLIDDELGRSMSEE